MPMHAGAWPATVFCVPASAARGGRARATFDRRRSGPLKAEAGNRAELSACRHRRRGQSGLNRAMGTAAKTAGSACRSCWSVPPSSRCRRHRWRRSSAPGPPRQAGVHVAETKISEIIRRRPFEEDEKVTPDGRGADPRRGTDPRRVARSGCRTPDAAIRPVPDRSCARCLQEPTANRDNTTTSPEHVRVTDLLKARQS